jgi:hypothetical protein
MTRSLIHRGIKASEQMEDQLIERPGADDTEGNLLLTQEIMSKGSLRVNHRINFDKFFVLLNSRPLISTAGFFFISALSGDLQGFGARGFLAG